MKRIFGKIGIGFKAVGAFFGRLFKPLTGLRVLTMMQLKEKLNFSFKADWKGALTKLILFIVMVAGITAVLSVGLYFMARLSVFAHSSIPISLFNTFFIFMYLLSILSCLNGLTDTLYFSKDNQVLLTYPVKPNTVFYSKIIVYYISDLIKNIGFIIPLFVAYGIVHRFQPVYYPWLLFCFLFISAIPVAISGLLSVPYMWFKMQAKRYPLIQNIFVLLVLVALTVLLISLINFIPPTMNIATAWSGTYAPAITNFCKTVNSFFPPFTYLVMLTMGDVASATTVSGLSVFFPLTGIIFAIFIGGLIVLFALTFLLVKPLFFKMAAAPFEIRKKAIIQEYEESKADFQTHTLPTYICPKGVKDGVSEEEHLTLVKKMKATLEKLRKEEVVFFRGRVTFSRIVRLLKKYAKIDFELKNYVEAEAPCYAVSTQYATPTLILVVASSESHVTCFDPIHTIKKNHASHSFVSLVFKDVLIDLRSSSAIVHMYLMMIFAPVVLVLLNSIFNAMTLNEVGKRLVPAVNVVILFLLFLGSNVNMASVYSKEGQTAYLLKTTPVNYQASLLAKLLVRAFMMSLSLVASIIVFDRYVTIQGALTPLFLAFGLFFFYLGHLVWSAELDYMNPQDKLYAETGENENISNPNETTSLVIAVIISGIIGFLTYFLLGEPVVLPAFAILKLAIIGFVFLLARLYLFFKKTQAYTTSRGERGKN